MRPWNKRLYVCGKPTRRSGTELVILNSHQKILNISNGHNSVRFSAQTYILLAPIYIVAPCLIKQKMCFKFLVICDVVLIFTLLSGGGHAYNFPKYQKLDDAYAQALRNSGALDKIFEYDRLASVLSDLGELEFGMVASWSPTDPVKYKGCEPLKVHRDPVQCAIDSKASSSDSWWVVIMAKFYVCFVITVKLWHWIIISQMMCEKTFLKYKRVVWHFSFEKITHHVSVLCSAEMWFSSLLAKVFLNFIHSVPLKIQWNSITTFQSNPEVPTNWLHWRVMRSHEKVILKLLPASVSVLMLPISYCWFSWIRIFSRCSYSHCLCKAMPLRGKIFTRISSCPCKTHLSQTHTTKLSLDMSRNDSSCVTVFSIFSSRWIHVTISTGRAAIRIFIRDSLTLKSRVRHITRL